MNRLLFLSMTDVWRKVHTEFCCCDFVCVHRVLSTLCTLHRYINFSCSVLLCIKMVSSHFFRINWVTHGNFYLNKNESHNLYKWKESDSFQVIDPMLLSFNVKTSYFKSFKFSDILLIFYENLLNSCYLHSFITFNNKRRENIFIAILVVVTDSKLICSSLQM